MRYLLLFILSINCGFTQNIPLDSISFEAFYNNELNAIVHLKKKQHEDTFNVKYQLHIAESYQKINCEDSAYATYYKVFEKEKRRQTLNDEDFRNLLFQLHLTESSKHDYNKDRRFFLNLLKIKTKNDLSDEWHAKIENEIFKDYFTDSLNYELAYQKIKTIQETNYYKNNATFKSAILLNLGNLYTSLKRFDASKTTLLSSLEIAKKNQDYLRQVYNLINLAVNENSRGNYKTAIDYLHQIEAIPNSKYNIKIGRIVANQFGNAYYGLKDSVKVAKYDAIRDNYSRIIDDFKKNSNFYEIDVKYQTKEKDEQIKSLSVLRESFTKHKTVYSILLFFVFLLALYSFLRWKRVDRKKKQLQQEKHSLKEAHQKTKIELETVKKVVINDYIVLKNKSKVYLKELIYVKSDGHYLNLHTTSKKEFVRGKISEIEKELPPNFIKCHRSYIVNENYIKQYNRTHVFMINGDSIPLSRGFKF